MSSRLEAATRQFKCRLLVSDKLYSLLSDVAKSYCRNVDRVTVKGSIQPMDLYTIDVDTSKLKLDPVVEIKDKKLMMQKHNQIKKRIKAQVIKGHFQTGTLFREDEDLRLITENCMPNNPYRDVWKVAFKDYIDGNWGEAKTKFESFMQERPDIQTTEVVYNYMGNRNFQAPSDWAGYRALTSK